MAAEKLTGIPLFESVVTALEGSSKSGKRATLASVLKKQKIKPYDWYSARTEVMHHGPKDLYARFVKVTGINGRGRPAKRQESVKAALHKAAPSEPVIAKSAGMSDMEKKKSLIAMISVIEELPEDERASVYYSAGHFLNLLPRG